MSLLTDPWFVLACVTFAGWAIGVLYQAVRAHIEAGRIEKEGVDMSMTHGKQEERWF